VLLCCCAVLCCALAGVRTCVRPDLGHCEQRGVVVHDVGLRRLHLLCRCLGCGLPALFPHPHVYMRARAHRHTHTKANTLRETGRKGVLVRGPSPTLSPTDPVPRREREWANTSCVSHSCRCLCLSRAHPDTCSTFVHRLHVDAHTHTHHTPTHPHTHPHPHPHPHIPVAAGIWTVGTLIFATTLWSGAGRSRPHVRRRCCPYWYVHRPRVRRRCCHYWPYISRLCTSLCLYSLRHIHWHTWHGELMLRCAWLLQVSSVSHPCCIACISCMFCAGCARVLCWSSVGGMHVFCMWLVHVCCVACACYHMPMCCACLAYALRGVSP